MHLQKHPVWEVFQDAKDFESFQNRILKSFQPNISLTNDLKVNIEVIKKLLLHSFYEYEFIDIALVQSIFTLEKALKLRYQEIHGVETKLKFQGLIDWFFNNGYFETWNREILHTIRKIRNGKVHEIEKTLGGIVYISLVYKIIGFINDLYENKALRSIRNQNIKSLQLILNDFTQEGAILHYHNLKYIIFQSAVIFINNKISPEIYSFAFWPIFDPTPYIRDGKHITPFSYFIEGKELAISKNCIKLIDAKTNENIELSLIDSKNIEKYKTWRKEIDPNINDGTLDMLIHSSMSDYYNDCLIQFYNSH